MIKESATLLLFIVWTCDRGSVKKGYLCTAAIEHFFSFIGCVFRSKTANHSSIIVTCSSHLCLSLSLLPFGTGSPCAQKLGSVSCILVPPYHFQQWNQAGKKVLNFSRFSFCSRKCLLDFFPIFFKHDSNSINDRRQQQE